MPSMWSPEARTKLHLQREFISLGQLADEEFAQEIGKRTFGELRRMAGVNGIKFTDKTTKQRLIASDSPVCPKGCF